jgi:hypothetical protein
VDRQLRETDKLLRFVAALVARNKLGVTLRLIGGLRYRLLDKSQRLSADLDYHCESPLEETQKEVLEFCQRVVVREVKRVLGYDGRASLRTGPDAESPGAKFVELRFWKPGVSVEVPVEICQIARLDPPTVRTVEGTVYATPSDADVIEGKVLAVFNRPFLQHRDLVDLFLFESQLVPDSATRLKQKIQSLQIRPESIRKRLKDLEEHSDYHAPSIQRVIDQQVEPEAAAQINAGGGGRMVLNVAVAALQRLCGTL